jgi:putative transposase
MYHVMSRGNFRQTIFPDERHITRYLLLLGRVSLRRRWVIVDWCVMPNHYHLVIQLTDDGLSDGMRELNGCYSRWSNAIHQLTGTGHLVRNRFRSRLVENDPYLWSLMRYIPLNPVRAGLVRHPQDWRWSSYRATVGREHPHPFHRPSETLRYFHSDPAIAIELYQRHLRPGPVHEEHDLWSDHGLSE